ncbi:ABC transporter ATP-binding protein [Parvibaculum sp.]|uniref:ABC transporter ATP-binding protein n=1 Tax=Parvibaculum sp. TaxID=2024848 RepID=UPI002C042054|nr:ABC transporter ATP-binding protein [Parvibaculum sp.]HUD51318.1 ABC transporter ATP-binding protein [Parvibaculum sp.]
MRVILKAHNVTKRFGGVIANDGVSLTVREGEIAGLIGPNGSGKSTLFGCIAGAYPIDGGEISFEGKPISKLRVGPIVRSGLVRTYQQTHVYDEMTALENMQISSRDAQGSVLTLLKPRARAINARAGELLAFVGLHEKRDHKAGSLSFGQQKLLEFAMALMSEPKLLLLDEPTAGINPTLINGLIDRLKRANEELGITLLVIEHNMRVIMNLASRITCLAHGRVLAEGTPDEIRGDARVLDAYLGAQ